jgi:NAD(P)-dependent dehydrogenase (short-subunit alcohol dehydrogenase family)
LARTGATVGMACRNQEKAALAKDEIMEEYPDAKIEVMKLDTSDGERICQEP